MPYRIQFGLVSLSFGRLKESPDEDIELKNIESISFRGVDQTQLINSIKKGNLATIWGDRNISITLNLLGGFKGGDFEASRLLMSYLLKRLPINLFAKFEFKEGFSRPLGQRMIKLEECHPTKIQLKKSENQLITISIDFLIKKFKLF